MEEKYTTAPSGIPGNDDYGENTPIVSDLYLYHIS